MASWKFLSRVSGVFGFFGSHDVRRATTLLAVVAFVSACGGARDDTGQAGTDPQLGQVTEALGTPPESGCTGFTYNGHDYWFCSSLRTWSTARTKCEAQGYNLVRIENAAENSFVKSHIGLDAWTGGNDVTTEGTWVWTFGGSNFWVGTASGHTVNGLFANWNSGEPNNLGNQDCGKMQLDGTWRDESCTLALRYVCESGTDMCGLDPNKVVPGICGCGVSDADTDGDGTPDCQDLCPADPTKIQPGDCGCSNAPRPSGTPCSDGLCAANNACNGAGVCGNPAACAAPDTNCTFGVFRNTYYWFCNHDRTFTDGRQRCQNVNMDVTAVESAAEDNFIESKVSQLDHVFIGGTDEATEGTFVWKSTGQTFWSGGSSGSATGGAYTNWETGEPSDGLTGRDCMAKDPGINGGQWEARSCTLVEGYVCEATDACPTDPFKTKPGACGCNHLETNTDGDAAPDCIDECPTDPNKTKRGVCDCGVPDADPDGDKVPSCVDGCPNDPNKQVLDTCGCSDNPAPAGTQCSDGICEGIQTCNGSGQCGSSEACSPVPGACTPKQFHGRIYWICSGSFTWNNANNACRGTPGQQLVEIDDAAENALVAAAVSVNSWIGGNDSGTEGQWRWATATSDGGPRFWTGGPDGQAYYARYTSWLGGQPAGSSGQNCSAILGPGATNGSWDDMNCGQPLAFVCEKPGPGDRLEGDPFHHTKDACGVLGITCHDPAPLNNCKTEAEVFGTLTDEQVRAALQACVDACKNGHENTPECAAACTGIAQPPDPNSRCAAFGTQAVESCALKDVAQPPTACSTDSQCPAGTVCGFFFNCRPDNGDGTSRCFATDATGGLGSGKVCGTPVDGCPTAQNEANFSERCGDIDLCETQWEQTVTDPFGPGSDLAPIDFNPETQFGPPDPEPNPAEPYPDDHNPCNGACNRGQGHPWCSYVVTDELTPRGDVNPDKKGRTNGSRVSFDFDPNLILSFGADVGALGLPTVHLKAEAGFSAGVTVNLPPMPSTTVPIINVDATLEATQCNIKGTGALDIFGKDFLPLIKRAAGASDFGFPFEQPSATAQKACTDAYTQFQQSVDRAKKAYRDAFELLRQYHVKADNDNPADPVTLTDNFGTALCNQVVSQRPRGFPAGNCGTESPETTINRFIEYYRRTVEGFSGLEGRKGVREVAIDLAINSFNFNQTFNLYSVSKSEEQTIAEAQFFVGPIPVVLEVLSTVDYGADVTATASFRPGMVVEQMVREDFAEATQPIAFVQATGTPFAGAGIALFAGVGFDIPGFDAEIGIEGDIKVGKIYVPAHAGAGIGLGSQLDGRADPADAVPFAFGPDLIRPKKYVADLDYSIGLEAKIRDVLQASVAARLKIEVLFFSASWRKTLFTLNGICSGPPEAKLGSPCDLPLVTVGGSTDAGTGPFPWGVIRMPMPFPRLANLTVPGPVGSGSFDPAIVEKLFYDSLCTCINGADPDEKRECFRNDDCCPNLPVCFPEPVSGAHKCITCRHRGDTCNQTADCCDSTIPFGPTCVDDPNDGIPSGVCRPRGDCGLACQTDDDCISGLVCFQGECDTNPPGLRCHPH